MFPTDALTRLINLNLLQYRNYDAAHYEFSAAVTCITGANGSGKTNLLDAIYYLCYTRSYFTASQQNLARMGTDGFRITGTFGNNPGETISCKWKAGKKELSRNEVPYDKITDHIGSFAAVMIAPDDVELINGGSEHRRRWTDSILGQTDKAYLEHLLRYQRVLLQRNAWLKMNADKLQPDYHELEYYDACLAEDGAYIFGQRQVFFDVFRPLLADCYRELSSGRELPQLDYHSDLQEKGSAEWLQQSLHADIRMQRTTRGIHKDELEMGIGHLPLKQFGSQGQKKSYLFALKLAQYRYLSQMHGRLPLLLLDDIFEKLDQDRMEALLRIIRGPGFGQVILTDTHPERIKAAFGAGSQVGFIYIGTGG